MDQDTYAQGYVKKLKQQRQFNKYLHRVQNHRQTVMGVNPMKMRDTKISLDQRSRTDFTMKRSASTHLKTSQPSIMNPGSIDRSSMVNALRETTMTGFSGAQLVPLNKTIENFGDSG